MRQIVTVWMTLALGCGRAAPDRCAEAAAALERCAGKVPEGFLAECDDGTDADTRDILDALIASPCEDTGLGSKADGLLESAFVGACLPVIASAFVVIRGRSGGGDPLPDGARDKLRPFFGGVVD